MNKIELIEKVAQDVQINKATAEKAVSSIIEHVTATLKSGDQFNFAGLGIFRVKTRKARVGRNPKTGEAVDIPARKVPVFKASATLKNAVK
ncbi:MAG: HU family DNA-binding protein [bacterium]